MLRVMCYCTIYCAFMNNVNLRGGAINNDLSNLTAYNTIYNANTVTGVDGL